MKIDARQRAAQINPATAAFANLAGFDLETTSRTKQQGNRGYHEISIGDGRDRERGGEGWAAERYPENVGDFISGSLKIKST